MRKMFLLQALCSLCLLFVVEYTQAAIISTFDTDDEGWEVVEFPGPPYDALAITPFAPNYLASGGNPGGAISSTDLDGTLFLFSAPSSFLGDIEQFYGGMLSYDLRFVDGAVGPGAYHPDVVLWGNGQVLTIDAYTDPATQTGLWNSYLVPLTADADWQFDDLSGAFASESEIREVLANLTGLYIRGDYWNGYDQTDLDNPQLSPVPIPGAGWLFGTVLIGCLGIRKKV